MTYISCDGKNCTLEIRYWLTTMIDAMMLVPYEQGECHHMKEDGHSDSRNRRHCDAIGGGRSMLGDSADETSSSIFIARY